MPIYLQQKQRLVEKNTFINKVRFKKYFYSVISCQIHTVSAWLILLAVNNKYSFFLFLHMNSSYFLMSESAMIQFDSEAVIHPSNSDVVTLLPEGHNQPLLTSMSGPCEVNRKLKLKWRRCIYSMHTIQTFILKGMSHENTGENTVHPKQWKLYTVKTR